MREDMELVVRLRRHGYEAGERWQTPFVPDPVAWTQVPEKLRFSDVLLLIGCALIENLGYRQLHVIWRLRGIINLIRGRTDWGTVHRAGFDRPVGARTNDG